MVFVRGLGRRSLWDRRDITGTCLRHVTDGRLRIVLISVDSDPRRENPPHLLQTPELISDRRRSLIYAAGVSACASFSS